MNIEINIEKEDLLSVKEVFYENKFYKAFDFFTLKCFFLFSLFNISLFLGILFINYIENLDILKEFFSSGLIIYGLIFMVILSFTISVLFNVIVRIFGGYKNYILKKYQYLIDNFRIAIIENNLFLQNENKEIKINLNNANLKIINNIAFLTELNNKKFPIIIPLNKINEKEELIFLLKEKINGMEKEHGM